MRKNEYETFEKFYDEYNSDRDIFQEHYTGIEIRYNEKYYRLSHDYSNSDNEEYKYYFYEIKNYFNPKNKEFILMGKYHNLDELLINVVINQKSFKTIIMDDDTEILSKD